MTTNFEPYLLLNNVITIGNKNPILITSLEVYAIHDTFSYGHPEFIDIEHTQN